MNKGQFIADRRRTATVAVAAGNLQVRGLSREQALYLKTLRGDQAAQERAMLRMAIIGPFTLDDDEVAAYYASADVDEVQQIIEEVKVLSGLSEGAAKSGVPGAGEGRGPGVRALPPDADPGVEDGRANEG